MNGNTCLRLTICLACSASIVAVLMVGCGGSGAYVSGTIKTNDQLIPEGQIVFTSDRYTCTGRIQDGEFELKHQGSYTIPLDDYTVTVFPPPNEVVFNPKTMEEDPLPLDYDPALFPSKFLSKQTSDLVLTPTQGRNDFNIELER